MTDKNCLLLDNTLSKLHAYQSKATVLQVFERASLPTVRPSQQDQRAYRLNVTSRGLHVLKIANVNIDSIIATQGKLLGELSVLFLFPRG